MTTKPIFTFAYIASLKVHVTAMNYAAIDKALVPLAVTTLQAILPLLSSKNEDLLGLTKDL